MLTVVRQSYLKGPEYFEGADGAEVVVIICTFAVASDKKFVSSGA